tara:strand:+ start:604 stop:804 length:201 start_codon:yes stop_codon:yes gene_type:complete
MVVQELAWSQNRPQLEAKGPISDPNCGDLVILPQVESPAVRILEPLPFPERDVYDDRVGLREPIAS